jgi:hypothetical protein
MIGQTVAELLDAHVGLDIEGIDRLYLNLYQPRLQTGGGVVGFFKRIFRDGYSGTDIPGQTTRIFRGYSGTDHEIVEFRWRSNYLGRHAVGANVLARAGISKR